MGGGEEKIWRDEKSERVGGIEGLTLFTAMQLWSTFEPGGVFVAASLSPPLSVL